MRVWKSLRVRHLTHCHSRNAALSDKHHNKTLPPNELVDTTSMYWNAPGKKNPSPPEAAAAEEAAAAASPGKKKPLPDAAAAEAAAAAASLGKKKVPNCSILRPPLDEPAMFLRPAETHRRMFKLLRTWNVHYICSILC